MMNINVNNGSGHSQSTPANSGDEYACLTSVAVRMPFFFRGALLFLPFKSFLVLNRIFTRR